ncbi:MAG: ABC transporter permease [Candidatus Cloacimonetes bacterium]|nr:ABC transporter permease [Candidatus Cloacimonadota bacterium]
MLNFIKNLLFELGKPILSSIKSIGKYSLFISHTILSFNKFPKRISLLFEQMHKIGVESLPLIAITSIFTGMVTAVQASYQTSGYLPHRLIGTLICKSTMIELAPVLTALVMAGKIGASLAAEIGTMRVSDQIDALEMLSINPFDFLIIPRLIAGIIMLPILTIFSNVFGILSGYLVSLSLYNISSTEFFNGIRNFFVPIDLWSGLIKSIVFGMIITSIGCFQGFYAKGGAEGVGKVTTRAVVISSIMILITDFLVATLIFR